MKKLPLFCSGVFISILLTAQTTTVRKTTATSKPVNTVCTVLKKIMDNRHNDFKDIYTWGFMHKILENTHGYAVPGIEHTWDVTGYDAKLKFPSANASFVTEFKQFDKTCLRYVAYWGRYKTAGEANKKIELLKKQISGCLPNYLVEERVGDGGLDATLHMMTRYEFFTQGQEWNSPKIFLQFEQGEYDDENCIFLLIQGNNCKLITDEPVIETVKPVVTPPSPNQSIFGKQVLKLLDYSKDGFHAIRGEKVKTLKEVDDNSGDTSLIHYYQPKFTLEGTKEIMIKVTFPNYNDKNVSTVEFNALFGEDLSMPEAENIFSHFATLIKNEFTGDFEINENKWDLSPAGDIYMKSIYVKPKNDEQHSFSLFLNAGLNKPGLGYVTTVKLKVE
jgi:hypothetical protein